MRRLALLLAACLLALPAHAQDEPPELPETAAFGVLKLLQHSRIEDAAREARKLDDDDPLTPYARASLAFHRGDYDAAAEALPDPMGHPEIERRLAYLRRNIEGAARAGVDAMLIAGGILQAEMQDDGFSTETVVAILAEYGVEARWIAPQLVWS